MTEAAEAIEEKNSDERITASAGDQARPDEQDRAGDGPANDDTDPWGDDVATRAMDFLNGDHTSFDADDAVQEEGPKEPKQTEDNYSQPGGQESAEETTEKSKAGSEPTEADKTQLASDADDSARLVKRFNTGAFGERERRIMDFMARNRDDNPSIEDAIAFVDQRFPHLAPPAPTAPPNAPPEDKNGENEEAKSATQRLASLDEQIAKLEEQMEEAANEYDAPKQAKLFREIRKLERQRMESELEARQEAQEQNAESATVTEASIERAAARYPAAQEVGTEFHTGLALEVERLERDDPGYFDRVPDWPEELTDRIARRLGVMPASPSTGEQAKNKPAGVPAPPQQTVRPVAPATSTSGTSGDAPNRAAEMDAIRNTEDPDALFAALNRIGTRNRG